MGICAILFLHHRRVETYVLPLGSAELEGVVDKVGEGHGVLLIGEWLRHVHGWTRLTPLGYPECPLRARGLRVGHEAPRRLGQGGTHQLLHHRGEGRSWVQLWGACFV